MTERRILLDTNAYFRLAQSIHPLLNSPFGVENYNLYVLEELQKEYERSPRLTNAFPWVNNPEYSGNRSHRLVVGNADKKEIKRGYSFILNYAHSVEPGVSKIDVLCLAYGEQLKIPVVTDDSDMQQVAKYYRIKIFRTIDLLKLMLDCQYITIEKIREIAGYWAYMKDVPTPRTFKADFKRIFGELPPT